MGWRVRRAAEAAAVAFSFVFVFALTALAQNSAATSSRSPVVAVTEGGAASAPVRANRPPGDFDFYVLALSWSPSFCASVKERTPGRVPKQQCGARPFSFVVHGLWPQYEHGYPSYCRRPAPRIKRGLVDGMLDLMPSPRLVFHEWNRHGTCTGLSAQAYFGAVRKARAVVTVPPAYRETAGTALVAPGEVAAAFRKANPGLSASAMAVACDGKRLTEVRFCLNKDFSFRDCPEVARRACRRDKVAMPAVRGGAN
jgi:ribonuclease T2